MLPEPTDFEDGPAAIAPTPANVKAERNRLNGVHHEVRPAPRVRVIDDTEAEVNLLSTIFVDPSTVMAKCIEADIRPASFIDPRHGIVFDHLLRLHQQGTEINPAILALELRASGDLDRLGGFPFIQQISGSAATTAQDTYFITKVADLARRRELLRIANRLTIGATDPGTDVAELSQQAEKLLQPKSTPGRSDPSRPITAFTYPKDDDPDILLGSDDYLGRGGGMLFVSHAGAGKSSWIMDACMSWSMGESWCGIVAKRPLKILIVQGEDSDRYIGKVVASFIHARKLNDPQQALLSQNCKIHRLKGVSGMAFFTAIKPLIAAEQPDLVIINPLYIYAEGDIGRSEYAQPFLSGLDLLNKEEKFAYILVHHTGKPSARNKDGKRADIEDWESVYMGFGSSYLANWPRCSALLEPVPNARGRYVIKLGKAGYNAGVTKLVDHEGVMRREPTTRIPIRHSTDKMPVGGRDRPVYYWEDDLATPVVEAPEGQPKGRPKKFTFSQFVSIMPKTADKALTRQALYRFACDVVNIGETSFREVLNEAVDDGLVIRTNRSGGFLYHLHSA